MPSEIKTSGIQPQRERGIIMSWNQRNKVKVNTRRRFFYSQNLPVSRSKLRRYYRKNRRRIMSANREWHAAYRLRLRTEMIAAYGGKCSCCGEPEVLFLQLDHVNNDGATDRAITHCGAAFLAKLKKQDWPKDRYQLLCANCNFGKLMNSGICPHKQSCANAA